MKVSVIIPTLNEEQQIEAAIDSARSAGECEIIVVDAGSTDRTRDFATKADQCLISPRGRSRQQNAGANSCTGDVYLFLHADCRLGLGAIDAVRRVLDESKCVGGCFRQSIDAEGLKYRLVETGNMLRVKACKWAYGDQGIFVRREVFHQLGGFPELELMEDLFLMKQLKRMGGFALIDPAIHVSSRRWQKHGVLRLTARNWLWLALVHCGVSPNRLAQFYANVR